MKLPKNKRQYYNILNKNNSASVLLAILFISFGCIRVQTTLILKILI